MYDLGAVGKEPMVRLLTHRAVDAAMQRRIVRSGGRVRAMRCPAMGASRHVARTVLAAMHHDGGLRAVLNIRYSEDVGLAVASFDRVHEPRGVSSMEWGTRTAIDAYRKLYNRVPDVVYDPGVVGKGPMVRLLAHRAVEAGGLVWRLRGSWVRGISCDFAYPSIIQYFKVRHDRHTVSLLTDHMVFSPKYRGKVLVGDVAMVAEGIIRKTYRELDIEVIDMAVNPDHVHIFIKYQPKYSVSYISKMIKGKSSRVLRKEFPHLKE